MNIDQYKIQESVFDQVFNIMYDEANHVVDDRGILVLGQKSDRTLDDRALRLDFGVDLDDERDDRTWARMAAQIAHDVTDLMINGDRYSTDPLLKTLDGFVKNPSHNVPHIKTGWHVHSERSEKRGIIEYTIYMLVSI